MKSVWFIILLITNIFAFSCESILLSMNEIFKDSVVDYNEGRYVTVCNNLDIYFELNEEFKRNKCNYTESYYNQLTNTVILVKILKCYE